MFICIAGKNNISVAVLEYLNRRNKENSYQLGVVCNKNETGIDNWQKSLLRCAKDIGVREYALEEVYGVKEQIFLSLEFDQIIRVERFTDARLYNLHFSMLPQYRGVYTSALPILHGKKKSGVTLHKIDAGIDTGDIIAQKEIEINEDDTSRDLYLKYIKYGVRLVCANIESILRGDDQAVPQPKRGATYFSRHAIDYSSAVIDLHQTAEQVRNQIRAFAFREYQLPEINGRKVVKADITEIRSRQRPGSILLENGTQMLVATIDYDVIIYFDRMKELHTACICGEFDRVRELAAVKEVINAQDSQGRSALMLAALHNRKEIAKYLVLTGADPFAVDYQGRNICKYAAAGCYYHRDDEILLWMRGLGAEER